MHLFRFVSDIVRRAQLPNVWRVMFCGTMDKAIDRHIVIIIIIIVVSYIFFCAHVHTHTHSSRQKKSQDFIIGLVMMCDVSTFDCHSSLIDWFVRSVNNVINSESLMFSQDHQINGDNNNENSFGIVSALKSATTKMKS